MNRHKHENTNWNPTSRQDAQSLLNAINFSFIVAIVIVRHILALTKPLTVKLQSKAMDILKAKEELALLISVLTEMSNDIDATHHELYQDAVTIARQVDVQPDKPRVAQRQTHRPNAPASNPEDYYKINLTRVFLDHVLEQLDSRFKDDVFICYKGGNNRRGHQRPYNCSCSRLRIDDGRLSWPML
ncbi:52 kDa repressor of the inhibitor of the protein kinase-like isoform X1 [Nematostella vectensis]|uniref:52 kDa repressor of the inhibitor of the protein kinase-like isoform X1 n=1 Tax=Nematostella vectensis TaxID=45351 RepID=UPI0020777B9F|nr:52 kDa repressor of the inhibitor of the protein kinase-like isoform X1 [Nematostella vectensis]